MPVQPTGYNPAPPATPYRESQTQPIGLNLEPGTAITIRVDKTEGSQETPATPQDQVTLGSGELPPSRYDELNAKYAPQYPGAGQTSSSATPKQSGVLKPPQGQEGQGQNATQASMANTQPKRLSSPQSSSQQPAGWLPPSSYTDMDHTLERYYISQPTNAFAANPSGSSSSGGAQNIASDIANLSSKGQNPS
jgi:hypothetical protein